MTLGSASEAFRLRCQAQQLSPGTLGWYKQILKMFERFVGTQGVTTARAVTPTLLRQHLEDMRSRGNSTVTVARTYGGLRCFFGFLARERLIPQNPCQLVEKPRMERKLIRPLSLEQVRLLLAQCNQKRYDEHRLWTIMVLIFDTGLRISEVIGLRKDAIDFQSGVMRVIGKGRKERSVPFSARTAQALLEYARARSRGPAKAPQLFLGRTGKPVCRSKARKLILRYGRAAGIEGVRLSPHTLRHTFAVLYVRNGGDSFSLQEILGHSTLEMTRQYVNLARRDVAEQHKKFSPIEFLAGRPPLPAKTPLETAGAASLR
ncbi:MAG: hypothetical protein A2V88_10340 [Elusimicrobia bacterium RBG_16_66_12]|nr:MAG: hypothetical protein A2V88_10340 [Elusimicrobia bacterium RBG_16_66_12]